MSTDKPKPKQTKVTWGALFIGLFGAISAVGNGYRAHVERKSDVQTAAQAEVARVEVDESIQKNLVASVTDLHTKRQEDYDELHGKFEKLSAANIELRIEVQAQKLYLESQNRSYARSNAKRKRKALETVAKKENHVVHVDMTPISSPAPDADVAIEKTAETIAKKKAKKRKESKRHKFEFAEPAPLYQMRQQRPQLPTLPPMPGKGK